MVNFKSIISPSYLLCAVVMVVEVTLVLLAIIIMAVSYGATPRYIRLSIFTFVFKIVIGVNGKGHISCYQTKKNVI